MQKLMVTAVMDEPVVYYEDGLHLDGPVSYGAFRDYTRNGGEQLPPIGGEWAVDFDLPFAKWQRDVPDGSDIEPRLLDADGKLWGWMTSAVDAEWQLRSKMEYRKKPDTQNMSRYSSDKTHNIAAGPLKAFDVAYPTTFASELRWYCIGDIDRIRYLLSLVSNLGKRSTTGMGLVRSWTVEPAEFSSLHRMMPCPGAMSHSIRAPYHHRSRFVPARFMDVLC